MHSACSLQFVAVWCYIVYKYLAIDRLYILEDSTAIKNEQYTLYNKNNNNVIFFYEIHHGIVILSQFVSKSYTYTTAAADRGRV